MYPTSLGCRRSELSLFIPERVLGGDFGGWIRVHWAQGTPGPRLPRWQNCPSFRVIVTLLGAPLTISCHLRCSAELSGQGQSRISTFFLHPRLSCLLPASAILIPFLLQQLAWFSSYFSVPSQFPLLASHSTSLHSTISYNCACFSRLFWVSSPHPRMDNSYEAGGPSRRRVRVRGRDLCGRSHPTLTSPSTTRPHRPASDLCSQPPASLTFPPICPLLFHAHTARVAS